MKHSIITVKHSVATPKQHLVEREGRPAAGAVPRCCLSVDKAQSEVLCRQL